MQEILCPHCGGVIAAQNASRFHERELEIQRLQSELEQICARFELQLQQKDGEIAIYKEIAERLIGGAAPLSDSALAAGCNADIVRALDQSIAGLMRVREMLLRSGDGSGKE